MSRPIRWSPRAQREADRLDSQVRRRTVAALDRFATAEHGDVVRLTDVDPPEFRLRVGDWRVRFRRDNGEGLYVLRVLPRGKAYC